MKLIISKEFEEWLENDENLEIWENVTDDDVVAFTVEFAVKFNCVAFNSLVNILLPTYNDLFIPHPPFINNAPVE